MPMPNGELDDTAEVATAAPRGTVTTDADLIAMSKIGKIIAGLGEVDRCRVVRYITEKYEVYLDE